MCVQILALSLCLDDWLNSLLLTSSVRFGDENSFISLELGWLIIGIVEVMVSFTTGTGLIGENTKLVLEVPHKCPRGGPSSQLQVWVGALQDKTKHTYLENQSGES